MSESRIKQLRDELEYINETYDCSTLLPKKLAEFNELLIDELERQEERLADLHNKVAVLQTMVALREESDTTADEEE